MATLLSARVATVICNNQRKLTAIFKPENTDLLLLIREKPTSEKSDAFCYHCLWSSQSWFYHFSLVWWAQLVMLMRDGHVAWRLSDWLNDACVVNAASQAQCVLFTGSQLYCLSAAESNKSLGASRGRDVAPSHGKCGSTSLCWLCQWEMATFNHIQNRHPSTDHQKICHRWFSRRPLQLCQIRCISVRGGASWQMGEI